MDGFPTLTELLDSISFLGNEPAAIGVLITALLLIVLRDWRWSLVALAIQYLLSGWLLTQVFEPDIAPAIAAIKILSWMIICLVLYLTARQVRWGSPRQESKDSADPIAVAPPSIKIGRWVLPTGQLFRLLIGLMATIVILYTVNRGNVALPELPAHISLAAISLMAMGLLALGLTEEPLTAGMGLLTSMGGFALFYHSLEQGITVIGFLIGVDFLIVAVSAYLTTAHHWTQEDAERRRPT